MASEQNSEGTPTDPVPNNTELPADEAPAAQIAVPVGELVATLTSKDAPAPQTPAESFRLVLPNFEGPLDLLLRLIRDHKIDILDIPIALITEKYLATLKTMRELDLNIAGEFIAMAATLTEIKSRMLLPDVEAVSEEDQPQVDPREELVRRLLAYQKYKAAAEALGGRALLNREVFTRRVRVEAAARSTGDTGLVEVSIFKLVEALAEVLKTAKPEVSHEVNLDQLNLGDTMAELIDKLRDTPRSSFVTLLSGSRERISILMTFLAILELCKMRLLRIVQEEDGGDILVWVRDPSTLPKAISMFKDDYL